MSDQKNMLIAIAISLAILLGFQFFYEFPKLEKERERQAQIAAQDKSQLPTPSNQGDDASVQAPGGGVSAPGVKSEVLTAQKRAEALKSAPRVGIESPTLVGSISLVGARLDDLVLKQYGQTVEVNSERIHLLHPSEVPKSYFAEFGWVGGSDSPNLPGPSTIWSSDGKQLKPGQPVTLSWDNGAGLKFERTYSLDEGYMVTVTQKVTNTGKTSTALFPYGLIARSGTPDTLGFYILHEGPLGVFDGTLREYDYDDVQETRKIEVTSNGGWIGITDKYWLAALVPDQAENFTYRFVHSIENKDDRYQVDYIGQSSSLAAGASIEITNRLFAGAKEVKLLDAYSEKFGIQNFDLAVDFGWFYFLTKPFFYAISWLNSYLGNFGLAILAFTVLVKAVFYPLANKSYRSMAKMRDLTPKLMTLREQYGDDKMRLNQEMMAIYKKEKVNPASGCLPILLQIPVFFALYKVLFVNIEMRHAPFYGWIKDLSVADPTSIFNAFGLIPWTPPDFLMIGIWPILMGLTMWLQQRLNPQPTDPVQAKVFMFLPLFFTFLLGTFPAGLVIYWTWNNLLSIAQQRLIMYRMGVK
ncbi:MAG: membrane protein insertase YidC [Rhodospirillaceae bacterium]|nr:membrane protein insertase YidC [Rhodospirillaceae bacterium]OUU18948.1 MAG: membrane protein insertase YidC [Candidatus Endolissoclinum sp. TMED37]